MFISLKTTMAKNVVKKNIFLNSSCFALSVITVLFCFSNRL
tara:strand:- start:6594 stop:6716 length:123 start_codon:yes stop_codon:yes gene_type:complete